VDDHKAFIRAILSDPSDDTARLVYADWLDEHEDPRGEFLRLEVREARGELNTHRLAELRSRLDPSWLMMVERLDVEKCPQPVEFKFQCPRSWDRLELTDDDRVRFCTACEQNVYYCQDVSSARTLASMGACVALPRHLPRSEGDLDRGGELLMGLLA
jgi:uncharacterized protein (TIGR02996 family)